MSICKFRNGTIIGDFEKPYIVAEVNTSHNGNVITAMDMIKKAKEIGCSCVKFQSWTQDSLYSKTYYKENPVAKRIFEKFSFSEKQLLTVAMYSKECGIDFASTPYSKKEVDFLIEKCEAPYIKIASMDLNNIPFIDYIARTGTSIVLATGMGSIDEIEKAVHTIEDAGNNNICLLHCVSIYPPKMSEIRLYNILGLRQEFPSYPIGFSDHSLGIEMASAATALGAAMIEKHFTLDSKKIGMDNQMAIEPEAMEQLIKNCLNIKIALGGMERIVSEDELEQRKKMRRSIVATRNLRSNEILKEEDMDVKRPGIGISPERLKDLIGRTLVNDIEEDTLILDRDFK